MSSNLQFIEIMRSCKRCPHVSQVSILTRSRVTRLESIFEQSGYRVQNRHSINTWKKKVTFVAHINFQYILKQLQKVIHTQICEFQHNYHIFKLFVSTSTASGELMYVTNVVNFSWLSILDCASGFLWHLYLNQIFHQGVYKEQKIKY